MDKANRTFRPCPAAVRNRFGVAAWSALAIVLLFPAAAPADAGVAAAPTSQSQSVAAPVHDYSGLDALAKAMAVEGVDVDMLDLLREAPSDPSDFAHLAKLAEARGLYVSEVPWMSVAELYASAHPVVLRVWAGPLSVEPDRFVLYLGQQDGQALIYNPPNPDKLVPFHVLATRWDGPAWVISREGARAADSSPSSAARAYAGSGCAIALLGLAGLARRRRLARQRTAGRHRPLIATALAGALVALAGALGFAYHSLSPAGLLFGGVPAREFARVPPSANFLPPGAPAAQPLPEITVAEARPLVGTTDALFIDARSEEEFLAGRIDGAIHVPSFTAKRRRLSLAGVPKDKRIIVYCINPGCPRAHSLANALREDGFNAWVLQGGWEAWGRDE